MAKTTRNTKASTEVATPVQVKETLAEQTETTSSQSRLNGSFSEELVSQLRFMNSYNDLQKRIEEQFNYLKTLRTEVRKLVSAYEHDMQRVQKSKRRRRANFEPTGFIKKSLLPNDLADLVGVAHGTEMSTPELTKRFYAVLKERNLCDEKDHRIFRPDTQMRRVFNLPDSVMTSTSHKDLNGFNFMTLQKHISTCLKQHNNLTTETPAPTPVVVAPVQASKQVKKGAKQASASA
jgi:chromatin remodeling complex protein RSC6